MTDSQAIASAGTEMMDRIGSPNSAGLRRNVLTVDGKRWQLWGKGVRGKAADEVIEKVYPELSHG